MSINQLNSVAAYKKSLLLNSCAKTKIDKKKQIWWNLIFSYFKLVIKQTILKIQSQGVFPNTPWTFFKAFWQELWFGVDQTVAFLYSFWQMKLPTESPPKPPFFGPRCPTKVHQRRARPPADRCSRRISAAGAPRNVVCREPRYTGRRRTVKTPGALPLLGAALAPLFFFQLAFNSLLLL